MLWNVWLFYWTDFEQFKLDFQNDSSPVHQLQQVLTSNPTESVKHRCVDVVRKESGPGMSSLSVTHSDQYGVLVTRGKVIIRDLCLHRASTGSLIRPSVPHAAVKTSPQLPPVGKYINKRADVIRSQCASLLASLKATQISARLYRSWLREATGPVEVTELRPHQHG